ncbi:translation elongation factor Ts [Anaeromassilibacillus sp. An200]|uniref:Elongation factor Ts n=1 Tax=Candidatus Caccousia stercoris TaxID=2840723 RepID=A0A9D1FUX4_9FIRM|nr:translation elongation factor Ts [Anaeromassilibacillus sp. An200]OUP13776.1 translation elongation factor Ts [Anaeromassilibacillus sp. An200]HIS79725.1 elongation factor Ts [Candidatus Caccousia stercoris]
MAFTAKDVAALREKTGCGMMDCKKALTASNGDMDAAVDYLREKGLAAATKKAGRIAAEGMAYAYVDGNVGVAIEVNAETDFVAKNADFQAFVKTVAETVASVNPADMDALLAAQAAGQSVSVEDLRKEKVLTIGENIKIRRFQRYEGAVTAYIHMGGKIAVLVRFDTSAEIAAKAEFQEYAKNIAMQIAAVNPLYLNSSVVPADVIEHERKIATEQASTSGKPANVIEKMVDGKIKKYFKEVCLVEQEYVKDSKLSIQQYTDSVAKELGGSIQIAEYVRFEKGEGLEKREDNFADEVASMVK